MSEQNDTQPVKHPMTLGIALMWIVGIGGLVLFTPPTPDGFQVASKDAVNILGNALQLALAVIK